MKKILLLPLMISLICLLPLSFHAQAQHSSCPNAICETGETYENCPQDCDPPDTCGNGICESYETTTSCPQDCLDPCGNGLCVELSGEDCQTCPIDCGTCPVEEPGPPDPEPDPEPEPEPETLTSEIDKEFLIRKGNSSRIQDLENSPLFPEFAPTRK
jgi:hypothetical protein